MKRTILLIIVAVLSFPWSRRRFFEDYEEPVLRWGSWLRAACWALLERRSHETERALASAVSPVLRAQDRWADSEERTAGCGSEELALL